MDSQGVAARAAMSAQADGINLRSVLDEKPGRFGGTSIKKRAGHVCKSGRDAIARILPYPAPLESFGAKTNHLPNIQG
jgi:hypothetical protein